MATPKAEQGRRAIIVYAQRQGWQVFRAVTVEGQPLPTSIVLMLGPTLLHVDVIPDRANGHGDAQARLTAAGITSYVVHSPSEVGQFCADLGDIASTRCAS